MTETEPETEPTPEPRWFLRHSVTRRIEHWVAALVFTTLAISGLAQRYHDQGWAEWVILHMGGIDQTRLIHRWAGGAFAVLFLIHIAVAVVGVLFMRWRPSMVISRKDFSDAVENIRYYLLLSPHPARCDRYDYRAKFEYWGIILGGMLMIATGFVLWFPVLLFQTIGFLPGEIVPASKAIHSNEAMLALVVLVIWHIYNSILSPEVFPLDRSMLTGRISRKRMIHEHPLEYERITGQPAPHNRAEPALPALVPTTEGEE